MVQLSTNDFTEQVQLRVVEIRTRLGLSQQKAAERVGVDWRTFRRWEIEYLNFHSVCQIAQAFDCSPYEFFKPARAARKRPGRPKKMRNWTKK